MRMLLPSNTIQVAVSNVCNKFQNSRCLFVCVEVFQPQSLNGIMSSVVSLPKHAFTGQAVRDGKR